VVACDRYDEVDGIRRKTELHSRSSLNASKRTADRIELEVTHMKKKTLKIKLLEKKIAPNGPMGKKRLA
jgi:hypothetical protein